MELIKEDIRMTVCDLNTARMLDEEAKRQGRTVHIHLAVDTGMSRIGYADDLHSVEEIREISKAAEPGDRRVIYTFCQSR